MSKIKTLVLGGVREWGPGCGDGNEEGSYGDYEIDTRGGEFLGAMCCG